MKDQLLEIKRILEMALPLSASLCRNGKNHGSVEFCESLKVKLEDVSNILKDIKCPE